MKMEIANAVVKEIDDCRTLLDFLNVFYKDKRIKKVKVTTSFFTNCSVMEKFWDWLDAQEIPNDKMKFLIVDIGEEKKKYLSKNLLIKTAFSDEKDKEDDNYENTIDYYDEEAYQCN